MAENGVLQWSLEEAVDRSTWRHGCGPHWRARLYEEPPRRVMRIRRVQIRSVTSQCLRIRYHAVPQKFSGANAVLQGIS